MNEIYSEMEYDMDERMVKVNKISEVFCSYYAAISLHVPSPSKAACLGNLSTIYFVTLLRVT